MNKNIQTFFRTILRSFGFDLVRYQYVPPDIAKSNARIFDLVKTYTMTTSERIDSLVEAVKYITKAKIEGAMVECGVWKGGSVMAMALALQALKDGERELYLYDTFTGMSEPSEVDISIQGEKARQTWTKLKISDDSSNYCFSPLEEVQKNLFRTGYPKDKFHFVKGRVENTIPQYAPPKIALLRLDTDWYESTKHELIHLFPRLSVNGVLILDDYGYWKGARKAVDEYFAESNHCILLNRIDNSSRIGIKIA